MGHRYTAIDGFYKGTRFIDELEALGEKLACEVYGADWASPYQARWIDPLC